MTNTINPTLFPLADVTTTQRSNPKEIAAKVQGMFMEMMLKSMEDSVGAEDGLFGNSPSADIYRGMFREHLASAISGQMKSPLEGIIDSALKKQQPSQATKESGATSSVFTNEESDHPDILPVNGIISSPKGWRRDPINGESRYHAGTDIAAPEGTPIRAVASGRVIESGVKDGYGNTVIIQTDDGRKMLYAHNNQNFVRVGDRVTQGEPIAEVGSSGRATGPHVHFEVKF